MKRFSAVAVWSLASLATYGRRLLHRLVQSKTHRSNLRFLTVLENSAKFFYLSKLFHFRHYGSNRAPLSLGFDAAWLKVNKGFTRELEQWIRDKLADHSDVYFVTQLQVIALERSFNVTNCDSYLRFLLVGRLLYLFVCLFGRWSSGCRTHVTWTPSVTTRTGRLGVTSRANLIVHYQTHVP